MHQDMPSGPAKAIDIKPEQGLQSTGPALSPEQLSAAQKVLGDRTNAVQEHMKRMAPDLPH